MAMQIHNMRMTLPTGFFRTSVVLSSLSRLSSKTRFSVPNSTGVYPGSVLQAQGSTRALRLCAFRGRSRHTAGFTPLDKFELPERELLNALGVDSPWGNRRVSLRPTPGSEVFTWVDSCLGDEELIDAVSRCILMHGMFEVWGHGRTKQEAVEDATRSRRIPERFAESSWSLSATRYGGDQLSREEEDTLTGGRIAGFLSASLGGPRVNASSSQIKIHLIEDLCPPPAPNIYSRKDLVGKMDATASVGGASCGDTPRRAENERHFFLCRVLQIGPAVGGRLILGRTSRRPKSGILRTLALADRKSRGRTAIEPELALFMANLAKVKRGSRVLDPFCGLCSLLLPAAKLGARTWGADIKGPAVAASALRKKHGTSGVSSAIISASQTLAEEGLGAREKRVENSGAGVAVTEEGCEANPDLQSLVGIFQDFETAGLSGPKLVMADIADKESAIRQPRFYDAIVTDPPYTVKESAQVASDERRNTTMFVEDPMPPAALDSADIPGTDLAPGVKGADRSVGDRLGNSSPSNVSPGVCNGRIPPSWKDARDGKTAVAVANGLVGMIISSLLTLARYVLKPGGRLVFFLPLRGADARLDELPPAVREKLCESESGDDKGNAEGARFLIVYATKQRLKSQNMCRWLVVLEKQQTKLTEMDVAASL